MAEMPTPDFAVPYAAPKQVNTMAEVQPIAPKKGFTYQVRTRFHQGSVKATYGSGG